MAYEIEVKELPPQATVSVRVTIAPNEIGDTLGVIFPEVWGYLQGRGVQPAGPPFARYHDFNAERVDLEAGLAVAEPVEGAGRIQASTLPGGQIATTWHVGPYDTLTQAYRALESWMQEQKWTPAAAPWEVYWTDPGDMSNPEDLRTEVLWPVR